MTIRNYKSEDFEQVKKLLQESKMYDEEWDSSENLSSINILVAVEKTDVYGVVYLINFGKRIGWIFRLIVRKDKRNQGLATALIDKAEEILKQNGAVEIGMFVDSSDKELQDFYKKRNFKPSEKSYFYMWRSAKS